MHSGPRWQERFASRLSARKLWSSRCSSSVFFNLFIINLLGVCLISSILLIASIVPLNLTAITGGLQVHCCFSNANELSIASSLPEALLNPLVHLNVKELCFGIQYLCTWVHRIWTLFSGWGIWALNRNNTFQNACRTHLRVQSTQTWSLRGSDMALSQPLHLWDQRYLTAYTGIQRRPWTFPGCWSKQIQYPQSLLSWPFPRWPWSLRVGFSPGLELLLSLCLKLSRLYEETILRLPAFLIKGPFCPKVFGWHFCLTWHQAVSLELC